MSDCGHEETMEDGITRYCCDCGAALAFYGLPEDDWIEGAPVGRVLNVDGEGWEK